MTLNDCFNETVKESFNNTKVSYWFKKTFPDISYVLICKLIRKGVIRINGSRIKISHILKENDQIKIPKALRCEKAEKVEVNLSNHSKRRALELVIYKDNEFIVLNKPSGLSVQGGTNVKINVDLLLDALRFDYDERPKLVHRIDKDTSGVLLIARTLESAKFATELFRNKKISKIYIAIVFGKLKENLGMIDFPLDEKDKLLDSKTYYKVIHVKSKYSIVALNPITGRKHQLRKQLYKLGNPIVGDDKYYVNNNITNNFLLKNKLNLHAFYLSFYRSDKKKLEFKILPNIKMIENFTKLGFDISNFNINSFLDSKQ